jgi:hypothetical protein
MSVKCGRHGEWNIIGIASTIGKDTNGDGGGVFLVRIMEPIKSTISG